MVRWGQCRLIMISKTARKEDLVRIYSAANCFINPTYEDNFPTVNIEAIACGISVVTYDTGGCGETIRLH